jgi:16S rRNA (guanine1516-N2)-methyltransferase
MTLSSIINEALEKMRHQNPDDDTDLHIELGTEGVIVHANQFKFRHSFSEPQFLKRLIQPNQLLIKACTNKQRSIRTVLDLTGGWGMDSFMIAHNGREVTMLEQNQLVYAITAHSLKCAETNPKISQAARRITALHSNGREFLADSESNAQFDCIYLDPMFPSHKSGAKPSKDMQLLQKMTGNIDIESVFKLALKQAKNRVVMKRPLKSTAFSDIQPDLVYREKTIRFDIYLTS